jgi:uncharacterized membrane protein YfhO
VNCAERCLVVESAAAYPGWTAAIDGTPATLTTVDGALRGIVVTAGRHEVALRFSPIVLTAGALIGGVSLVLLLLFTAVGFRFRKAR